MEVEMKNPTTFLHKGYEAICGAMPLQAGGFAATLVVAKEHGAHRDEITIPLVHAPTFATAADAITHAIGKTASTGSTTTADIRRPSAAVRFIGR
jgi:hypothetical protein